MDNKNKTKLVQMLPNSYVDVIAPGIENVTIMSNVFADIEVVKDGPCIKINICGLPKVNQIIYGE